MVPLVGLACGELDGQESSEIRKTRYNAVEGTATAAAAEAPSASAAAQSHGRERITFRHQSRELTVKITGPFLLLTT